jgi:hypothetical protein
MSFQAQAARFHFSPIPDASLRRFARRPNRLTRDEAADGGELRKAAGAAARAAPDKRGVTRLHRWCAKHSCAALMMRQGAGFNIALRIDAVNLKD